MHLLADVELGLLQMSADPATASPLAVMCGVMCLRLQEKDYKAAVEIAAMAAPYVHARLNASDVNVHHTLSSRSDAEIAADITELRRKIAAAKTIDALPVYTAPEPEHADLRQPTGQPSYSETLDIPDPASAKTPQDAS
jgi:hypothetical protein